MMTKRYSWIMDVATSAIAFQIYEQMDMMFYQGAYEALELYGASHTITYSSESDLEKINLRPKCLLEQKLETGPVDDALMIPYYATLERLVYRRTIEQYNTDNSRILKTLSLSANISSTEFPRLALEDVNACQCIYQEEA
ncbi:hypothetical protein AgCh_004709 [Apium graveolens]